MEAEDATTKPGAKGRTMPPTGPKSKGDDWLGTPDAAAYLGITQRTLYRLMHEGR